MPTMTILHLCSVKNSLPQHCAPPVMKASPTRTKWLSDKVVAYASVFLSHPRPVFCHWMATKLGLDLFPKNHENVL